MIQEYPQYMEYTANVLEFMNYSILRYLKNTLLSHVGAQISQCA